nr:hypothetical protein [Tanacetum cinerariifolium]
VIHIRCKKIKDMLTVDALGINSNNFADSIGAGQSSMKTGSNQDYILMPLWKDGSTIFDSSLKLSDDAGSPSFGDAGKKHDEVLDKESGALNELNYAFENLNTKSLDDLKMHGLKTIATYDVSKKEADFTNLESSIHVSPTPTTRIHKNHPLKQVIGSLNTPVQTRSKLKPTNEQGFISTVYEGKTHEDLNTCLFTCFLSKIELTRVVKALSDPAWGKKAIGIKWVFRNKKDKRGIVIKNKARLVSQGYTQEEGIYYDEVFALVARIEAIRLFLAYASFMGFMMYQIDVKSAFLYERIEEGVYVCQPPRFEDPNHPDKVYKVVKSLYGLQVKQKEDGIFISQDKYVAEVLRKFNFSDVQSASTPVDMEKTLIKDGDGDDIDVHLYRSMIGSLMYLTTSRPDIIDSSFELVAYTDSDYARESLDMKSTIGGCQFLGSRLISWQCKKQTVVATSTSEAEYVAAASCCRQVKQSSMVGFGEMIQYNLTIGLDRNNCYNRWEIKVVTEASVRRHLKLEDSDGISNLHTTEIFKQLALMSNMKRASKGYYGVDIPLFPTMLVHGLIFQGEGSTVAMRLHPLDVRHGGTTTTITSLDARQVSGNINKTPSMPYDLPLLRVHTLGSNKGIMQHNELMDLVTKLSDRVVTLETDLKQTKKVYGAAYTKLIMKVKKLEKTVKTSQARRRAKIVVSDDEEDLEDPSKQGRKIDEIDQDPDISLIQHDAEI